MNEVYLTKINGINFLNRGTTRIGRFVFVEELGEFIYEHDKAYIINEHVAYALINAITSLNKEASNA